MEQRHKQAVSSSHLRAHHMLMSCSTAGACSQAWLCSVATVINAWHRAQDRTGRQSVHIRDVLHEAMRQKAYLSQVGTYWIGSVAPIAAHFGFRTIWGYDAISYLTYAAAVFDTAAGHQLFAALEDFLLGPSAPLQRYPTVYTQ